MELYLLCFVVEYLSLVYIFCVAGYYMGKTMEGEYPGGKYPPKHPKLWEATRIMLYAIGFIAAFGAWGVQAVAC